MPKTCGNQAGRLSPPNLTQQVLQVVCDPLNGLLQLGDLAFLLLKQRSDVVKIGDAYGHAASNALDKGLFVIGPGHAANGLSAQEVVKACNEAGITSVGIENYSPQLSSFKNNDGLLTLENGVWRITQKGREYLASTKS